MSASGSDQSDDVFPLDDILSEIPNESAPATKGEDAGDANPPQDGAEAAVFPDKARHDSNARNARNTGKTARSTAKTVGGILRKTDLALAQIDAALAAEDPGFNHSLSELKREKISAGISPDDLEIDVEDEVEKLEGSPEATQVPRPRSGFEWKGIFAFVTGAVGIVGQGCRSVASAPSTVGFGLKMLVRMMKTKVLPKSLARIKEAGQNLKAFVGWLKALPLKGKMSLLGIFVLGTVLVMTVDRLRKGHLLPDFEVHFIPSVAAFADRSWTYGEQEEMEDFYSPLLHPEHVVLLEKVIVNLRPDEGAGKNSMGLFEFYVEASSREAAIEVNERQTEINDVVHRTVESITYDEVATLAGKNKLKIVLRKNINTVLSKGRIRKVYFKTIVLKP